MVPMATVTMRRRRRRRRGRRGRRREAKGAREGVFFCVSARARERGMAR